MEKKTICIDARMWGISHTGIGRYVENLIENLPQDQNFKYVLLTHPVNSNEPKLAKFEKYYSSFHPYSVLSQFDTIYQLLKIKPDLVHFTHFSMPILWPGKFVVTIHDLIKHYSSGPATSTRHPLLYWFKFLGYKILLYSALRRAQNIIVPTNYWRQEIVKNYGIDPSKVVVTYEGVSSHFKNHRLLKPHHQISQPYLIYTGNLYPHKNVGVLIEAVNYLNETRGKPLKLAVVCARSVFENRLPASPYVQYLGRVNDEELVSLYQHADCFVFPSLIEGFGLPGLEAMSVGCPVISSWTTCLPEVYGDAAIYFDPHNYRDLVDKIQELSKDNSLRKKLISKGLRKAKSYSWSNTAKLTWEIYRKMLL